MVRYLRYVLACQWYSITLLLFWVHSFLVFLTKPGARLIIPILLFGLVYLLRSPIEAGIGHEVDAVWVGVLPAFVGSDIAQMLAFARIEISILVMLAVFMVFFLLFASILRPIMGAVWAPQQPLPPMLPLTLPDTTVHAEPVKRLLKRRHYRKLKHGLETLSVELPEHLQAVLQQNSFRRLEQPTTLPEWPTSAPLNTNQSPPASMLRPVAANKEPPVETDEVTLPPRLVPPKKS